MAKNHGNNGQHGHGGKGKTDPTAYFTTGLTFKQARKQAKRVSRMAIQPERRQISAEKRASQKRVKQIGPWFGEYDKSLQNSQATTTSAYDKANSQIQGASSNAANYAETLRSKLAQEDQANAAVRGAAYDPSSSHTDASAQLARINAANVLSGVTASQGASQSAYLADKRAIGHREKIAQKLQEQDRGRSYNADLRSLAQKQADLRRDEMSRIRTSEQNFFLANQTAKNTRKNAKLQAQVSTANSKRSAAVQKRGQNISAQTAANAQAISAKNAKTSRRSQKSLAKQRRWERHHPGQSSSGGNPNNDPSQVKRIVAILNAVPPKVEAKLHTKSQWIAYILSGSTTISRREAEIAYARWQAKRR